MQEEDFDIIAESLRKEIDPFLEDGDGVALVITNVRGDIHYSGNQCLVCLSEYVMKLVKDGVIKHKGEKGEHK